jgi:hypothetical protein
MANQVNQPIGTVTHTFGEYSGDGTVRNTTDLIAGIFQLVAECHPEFEHLAKDFARGFESREELADWTSTAFKLGRICAGFDESYYATPVDLKKGPIANLYEHILGEGE